MAGMGDEVVLRDVEATDLEVFFEQEQDPEANQRAKFPAREHELFMTHWKNNVLGGDPRNHVQAVIVDGRVAGHMDAWWDGDRRFIGYWFGRDFWGRGIGSAAMASFLRQEEVRPLHADPHEGNAASVRLLEKFGFERAGVNDEGFVLLILPEGS